MAVCCSLYWDSKERNGQGRWKLVLSRPPSSEHVKLNADHFDPEAAQAEAARLLARRGFLVAEWSSTNGASFSTTAAGTAA